VSLSTPGSIIILTEKKLRRLGRHVEHDPRSKAFAVSRVKPLVSKTWKRHCDVFDQGDLGQCTAETGVGVMMTDPFYSPSLVLNQGHCTQLYSEATKYDKIPGNYPPDDTGSSGLGVAKAMHKRGWIKSYYHAFTLHAALASLGSGPGMLGIPWYEGFDEPVGPKAELFIAGSVRGGHEVQVLSIDVDRQLIRGPNSWGPDWGDKGYFTMSFETLDRLLHEQGDYTVPQL
jgi:hypothetical protein